MKNWVTLKTEQKKNSKIINSRLYQLVFIAYNTVPIQVFYVSLVNLEHCETKYYIYELYIIQSLNDSIKSKFLLTVMAINENLLIIAYQTGISKKNPSIIVIYNITIYFER